MLQPKKPWEQEYQTEETPQAKKPWEMGLQSDEVKKKESTESTSTIPQTSSVLEPKNGSSATLKKPLNLTEQNSNLLNRLSLEKQLANPKGLQREERLAKSKELVAINNRQKELDKKVVGDLVAKIDDVSVEKAQLNLSNTKNDSQGIDYLREGAKGVWNTFVDVIGIGGSKETKDTWKINKFTPLQEEKDAIQSQSKERIPEEQLAKMAEDLFIQKDLQKQRAKNADDILQNTDPRIQEMAKTAQVNKLNLKSPLLKANTVKINVIDKAYNSYLDDIQKDDEIIAKAKKEGKQLDPQFIESYNQRIESVNSVKEQYVKLLEENEKLSEEVNGAQRNLDLFKLNYSPLDKYVIGLANATQRLAGGAVAFGSEFLPKDSGLPLMNEAKDFSARLGDELISEAEDNNKQFRQIRLDDVQTPRDFGRYAMNLIVEQTPIIASMAVGGEVGLAGLGASSGGEKINEMRKDLELIPTKYSDAQVKLTGLGYALAEAIPELQTLSIIRGAKRTIQEIGKDEAQRRLFRQGIKDYSLEILSKSGKTLSNATKEGLSENLTGIMQDYIDEKNGIQVQGKKEKRKEEFVAGFIMGGGMTAIAQAPSVYGYIASQVSNEKQQAEVKTQLNKLATLEKEMLKNDLTDNDKKVLASEIKSTNKTIKKIVTSAVKNAEGMSRNQIEELVKTNSIQADLRTQAEEIKAGNLSDDIKKAKLADLKKLFSASEDKRLGIQEGRVTAVDLLPIKEQDKLKRTALKELTAELNPDGKKNIEIDNKQITERANKNYLKSQEDAKIEMPIAETEIKTEVQEPTITNEEKVSTEPISVSTEPTSVLSENQEVIIDEKQTKGNITDNGTLGIGIEQIGEMGSESQPTAEVTETEVVEPVIESKPSEGVVEVAKGKEIEPRKEVNTDVETVKKELKLDEIDNLIYDEFNNVPEDQISKKFEKVKDDKYGEIEKIESDINDIDIKIEDNGIDIDNINNDEDLTSAKKKKAIAEKEKEYKELQKQQKELQSKKEVAEQFLEDFDNKLYDPYEDYNLDTINKVINRVNTRLETRKAVKNGTDLFPETANIPELTKLPSRKEKVAEKIDIYNAKIDDIANALKDLLPKAPNTDGLNKQGISQDELIDFIANSAKQLVSATITIEDAIRQVIAHLKSKGFDFDEKAITDKLFPKEEGTFERKAGKKSLLTRATTGSDAVLKRAISKYSLDYEIENQEAAKNNADAFVEEVGIEEALTAVRLGKDGKNSQIVGAERAFVYAKIIDEITNNINQYTEEERQRLEELNVEILGEISNEFDKETRNAGRFIAALRKVYKGSLGRYNLSKQIADYKALNNGEISDDVLRKFTEANARIKELEAKLDELEKEKEVQEAEQEFKNIVEAVARKNKISATRKISNKEKAKEFANKLRSYKTTQKGTLSAVTPMSLAYDGAIEVSAKIIEQGGKLADAIKKGIDFIKGEDKLSDQEKNDAVNQLMNAFNQVDSQPKNIVVDDNGKLKIPASLIREYVENGIDNIDDLVEALKTDVEEMFPGEDFTDRQIRDAVSQYGKISNPTQDEIEIQIGIMKSLGRLISGLEDAYSGKRPLRSGLQRRALTLEERAMQRKLKELLRDLPMDDADLARTWKTALETIKSRLQNQIADLDKQIEVGEKRKAEKKTVEYDDEAKALRDLRDQKRQILDDLVGKPELTEEEKIDKAIILTQNSIEKLQEKIINGEIEYKKKPTPVTSAKLESLRELRKSFQKQIEEMRKDSGLAEMKRLETAKKSRINRIEELKRKIREKDYSVREQKPLPIDSELLKIESELQEQKDIYEKEKHIHELNNRSVFRKAMTNLVNVVGITRLLKAGGEFSQVLVQQGFLTPEMLVRNPKQFFKAMYKLGKAFVSPESAKLYEAEMKSNPLYPLMQKTKLSLTGTDHKLDAQEENYQLDLITDTWNAIGEGIDKATKEKKVRTLTGIIKSALGKELSEKDRKTLGEQFKEASVWKMFERGAVTYSNHIKMVKFEQGVRELQKQGKDPINNIEDYKKVAKYINVFSGRANLGKAEMISKDAALLVFSLRNAVSQFQQLNPVFYLSGLGDLKNIKSISDLKKVRPTVAQKMAVKSFMTSFTAIVAFKLAFMAWANSSADDDEEKWKMETDPRSSDFGKLRKGDKTFDLWHGLNGLAVLYARLLSQETKSIKSGEVKGLGTGFGTATSSDLLVRYGTNKLAPTAGYFWRLGQTHKEVDPNTGKAYRVDKFGNVYGDKEMADLFVPIYWSAVNEIAKEDPDAYEGFLMSLGLLGMSIGTDQKGESFKDLVGGQEVKRPERPQRPKRP